MCGQECKHDSDSSPSPGHHRLLRTGPDGSYGMSYTTINIEGGLFSPDLLDRIAVGDGDIKGQAAKDFRLSSNRHLFDEIQRSFSDARAYWNAFNRRLERSKESSTTLTRRYWMSDLVELLGFTPLEYQRAAVDAGGASFPISHRTPQRRKCHAGPHRLCKPAS